MRQLVKSLSRKFAKLVRKDVHITLKMAAQAEFQKAAVFCPELLDESQALDLSKHIIAS